jgi:hypothetical protein
MFQWFQSFSITVWLYVQYIYTYIYIYLYIYIYIYILFIYLNVSPDTPASQTLGHLWQLGPHQAQLQVLQLEGTAQLLDRSKIAVLYQVYTRCMYHVYHV